MTTRVYVPLTSTGVAALVAERRLAGPLPAHTVTEELRLAWPEAEQDDWEFAAMLAAGEDSWTSRAAGDAPRRFVLAVDAAEVTDGEGTGVTVGDVVWKRIASLHADTEDWSGEPDLDADLAWFATQEIPDLLG